MKHTIINTNIVILLKELQEAIREGYRIVPNDSFLSCFYLYELSVYKEDVDVEKLDVTSMEQEVVVEEYDKDKFLQVLQMYLLNGYELDLDSVWWDSTGIKVVKLILSDDPCLKHWLKEELEQLHYDELKHIATYRECFHRSKQQMVRNILLSQEGDSV